MLVLNCIIFALGLFLSRKNPFSTFFLILFFTFCYSRYLVSGISEEFSLGGSEWVFPGTTQETILNYEFLYTICQSIVVTSLFLINKPKIKQKNISAPNIFFGLALSIALLLLLKGYYISSIVFTSGYLAAVDTQLPSSLSIIASTFSKPLAISFTILYYVTRENKYKNWLILYCLLFLLSWQRKDLISILILYFSFSLLTPGSYKKLPVYVFFSAAVAFGSFYIREGIQWDQNYILSAIWAAGISVNSGFFAIDNAHHLDAISSIGFLSTYFFCGVGRIFSDVCFSPERLEYPGFLLEKISHLLSFEEETTFGGLGGNLIGSTFIAADLQTKTLAPFSLIFFLIIVLIYTALGLLLFRKGFTSVTGCLFLMNYIISSRYAFDSLIPAANQLAVAISIDLLVLRPRTLPFFRRARGRRLASNDLELNSTSDTK